VSRVLAFQDLDAAVTRKVPESVSAVPMSPDDPCGFPRGLDEPVQHEPYTRQQTRSVRSEP